MTIETYSFDTAKEPHIHTNDGKIIRLIDRKVFNGKTLEKTLSESEIKIIFDTLRAERVTKGMVV